MSDDEINVIAECTECKRKLTKSILNEKRKDIMYHNLFENKDESIRIEEILKEEISKHKKYCNGKLLVIEQLISEEI
jgi:hypothetical protein